ncbi:hypothetical protein WDZ17_14930 [Pseudokineococcus basanitobsidens]|uniref:Uncharacterized protein n=1 Tax=Pseudokineococcus basanitobsidens TaxID=1926649 RepID=A0ABU8RNE2_9ACTN
MLRRHPRATSFVLRFVAIIAALLLVDLLVPGLGFVVRLGVAFVASLVVGLLVDRWLGLGGGRDRANGPPGQS